MDPSKIRISKKENFNDKIHNFLILCLVSRNFDKFIVFMSLAFQVLYPSARDSGVLLPDVEADQGPQVPGVGLGDGPGAGQALQVRSRVLGHQKCLPGKDMDWLFKLHTMHARLL